MELKVPNQKDSRMFYERTFTETAIPNTMQISLKEGMI